MRLLVVAIVVGLTGSAGAAIASSPRGDDVPRRSAIPPRPAATPPTPAGPARPKVAPPPRAAAAAAAPHLAGPACDQYAATRAGRLPGALRARGQRRALAFATESVSSALLGLPIEARASAGRERIGSARRRLAQALSAGDDAGAQAIARAAAPLIARYARALGIDGCG